MKLETGLKGKKGSLVDFASVQIIEKQEGREEEGGEGEEEAEGEGEGERGEAGQEEREEE